MARPCKLTPELQEGICATIRVGVDIETACKREGISRATWIDWRKRGREGEEPFAGFLEATERALATSEGEIVEHVVKAARSDWRAAAWYLEKRNRPVYGTSQRVELTGADGEPIKTQTEHRVLTSEDAAEIREKILFGRGREDEPP